MLNHWYRRAKEPWRPTVEFRGALKIMCNDWKEKKLFDQNYLKGFINFLANSKDEETPGALIPKRDEK